VSAAQPSDARFGRFLGASPAMRRVYRLLEKVADNDLPVLITGESGTGKELFARELHDRSARRTAPFVTVNCAAIAETLFESELFGHERGAFTGAIAQKRGRIELADCGTLFLDEIGEIPAQTQVKLLRFLQEHEFERVGGSGPIHVDVRIVAATNRDLPAAIRMGQFREDLFYRLNVIPVALPPLRERDGDVDLLAAHFVSELSRTLARDKRLSEEALRALRAYPWPGNVRELENMIERALVLSDGDDVGVDDLPAEIRGTFAEPAPSPPEEDLNLARRLGALERELLVRALERSEGDLAQAATLLGVKRSALVEKLRRHGLPS
jgi:transcriptional regulator with GAF, ATPase, and Fis domain